MFNKDLWNEVDEQTCLLGFAEFFQFDELAKLKEADAVGGGWG